MPGKVKAAPRGRRGDSGDVGVGQRDSRKYNPPTDERQALTEREICDARVYLGTVRETSDGSFVAMVGEEVFGPYPSAKAATDELLRLVREGGHE